MNISDADKMMLGLCLFVLLGLSTTQIGMAWSRVKEFFGRFIEDDPDEAQS